jgi:bifunctional DNase/RNase
MVPLVLGRIVIREGADQQYIFLKERDGQRGFPIVIGSQEAHEIRRVATGIQTERPLTHQLAHDAVRALGAEIQRVEIVDLKNNTFYARLVLQNKKGETIAAVDARPSDAVALALRAGCPMHVAEFVLEGVRTDTSGPDPLPPSEQP